MAEQPPESISNARCLSPLPKQPRVSLPLLLLDAWRDHLGVATAAPAGAQRRRSARRLPCHERNSPSVSAQSYRSSSISGVSFGRTGRPRSRRSSSPDDCWPARSLQAPGLSGFSLRHESKRLGNRFGERAAIAHKQRRRPRRCCLLPSPWPAAIGTSPVQSQAMVRGECARTHPPVSISSTPTAA
jgi:hypothetical protein